MLLLHSAHKETNEIKYEIVYGELVMPKIYDHMRKDGIRALHVRTEK